MVKVTSSWACYFDQISKDFLSMVCFRACAVFYESVSTWMTLSYLESDPTASVRCSSGVEVAEGTIGGAWYDIFGVGGALDAVGNVAETEIK